MEINNKVKEILQIVFGVDYAHTVNVFNAETIDGWDSMKQVLLISALENEFDAFIEADEATSLTSYKKIVEYFE